MPRVLVAVLIATTVFFCSRLARAQYDQVLDPYATPPVAQMDDHEVPGSRVAPQDPCNCDPPQPQPRFAYPPIPIAGTMPPTKQWRLVLGSDGHFYRERAVTQSRLGALFVGLGVLVMPYALTAVYVRTSNWVFVPVIGSFVSAGQSDNSLLAAGAVLGGIAQIAGVALVIVGATGTSKQKIERHKIALGGGPVAGGGLLALSGRF